MREFSSQETKNSSDEWKVTSEELATRHCFHDLIHLHMTHHLSLVTHHLSLYL